MSTESLNRTSDVVQNPSEIGDTPTRVNVDVLKQRIIDQKKKDKFKSGKYELIFYIGDYFNKMIESKSPPFLDDVIVRFGISNNQESYHVPLLVSPWSYSTYRGS